jgi:L-ascorbate metabolism protein UlaG (beta-lactamase superfamily)
MIVAICVVLFLVISYFLVLRLPQFGKLPGGERLEKIKASPNYRDGAFQNQSHTPVLTEGVTYWRAFKDFLFGKKIRVKPEGKIPSVKTDLHDIGIEKDVLIWFGHSSYFFQLNGKRFLVDPVLSGHASPFSFSVKAFEGSDIYKAEDIPSIDYLFITHDHWDHLDYETMLKLKPKIKKVVCSLGTGAHLERWGFEKSMIIEMDWNEKIELENGFIVYSVPGRHFAGRTTKRNTALWTAYVLQSPGFKLFIGGDSGYDSHFLETGSKHGPFDLAILENGQYDWKWKYIHMLPGDFWKAANELRARKVLPVHSSKFALSVHPWDDPLKLVSGSRQEGDPELITPMIGEPVWLGSTDQTFKKWWTNVS